MELLTLQQNKLHRIFIDNKISLGKNINIADETLNHIKNSLRIKNEDNILIFNGDGKEYLAKINYSAKEMILNVMDVIRHNEVDTHEIILLQCISSIKSMNLTIQKSVELGISKIIPIISDRCQPGSYNKKKSNWEKIIISATEQSHGLFIADIDDATHFEEIVDNAKYNDYKKLCFHIDGRTITNSDKSGKKHIILIGPEGGFSDLEIKLLEKYNWSIIKLGDRVLRSETAAIVAQSTLRNY